MKTLFTSFLLSISCASVVLAACPPATIQAKIQLQGAFNASGQMNTALKTVSTFPLSEPYTGLGFPTRSSTGTETTTAGVLSASPVVDWVLLELRNKNNPDEVLFTAAGLLLADGSLANPVTGTAGLTVAVPEDDYYVAVAHRNHLRIRTAAVQHIAPATPLSLDFTTGALAVQETAPGTAQIALSNGTLALRAGDANHNGNVRFNGPANDRDAILSYLGGNEIGFVSDVYVPEDVNLNGNVRYNGPANDRDALLGYLGSDEIGFVSAQTPAGTLSATTPECSETPTPVTWSYFKASASGKTVNITWETLSERNSAFFEVQHATDAYSFETVGIVKAKSATQQKNSYLFTDKPASFHIRHYYRLKQVDADGAYSFSTVAAVQLDGYVGIRLSAASNPSAKADMEVLVEYGDPTLTPAATVELYTLQGRLVGRQQLSLTNGTNRVRFDASNLAPGTYVVSLKNASLLRPVTQKLVRQ